MTLTAPKSRQGKLTLVLAAFIAVVAVIGALAWVSMAQADLPTTTAELDQDPDGGSAVAAGEVVTYTATATLTGGSIPASSGIGIELDIDADLINIGVVCADPGAASSIPDTTGPEVGCHFDNASVFPDGVYSATVTANVGAATGTISSPTNAEVCEDVNDDVDCDDEADANDVQAFADADSDVGDLPITAPVTVADATNFPGEPHTFIFSLATGVTCESDASDDGTVACASGDVVIGGTAGCAVTAGPTVTDDDTADESFVTVTIDGGTGIEGTCTVTLDTKFDGATSPGGDEFDIAAVTATKTFDVTEAAGELRHLDAPDAATEDAAGVNDSDPLEDWCAGAPGTCGILTPQDDSDDATGSFHQACIINGSLTHDGDSGFITWDIVAVAGSPLPLAVSITEVRGPHDTDPALAEPCVSWSTGFTGVQNITAVYDNGVGPAVTFYWDGYCVAGGSCAVVEDSDTYGLDTPATDLPDTVVPLPLVKEWNTIDETKIVAVTGVVGDTIAVNTLGLGADAAAWAARDCSTDPADAGLCTAANVDGLTLAQEATIFLQTPQLFINAPAVSFIDYTLGSHDTDPGGSYDGPVDGAQQTYTISGDCGSVRLEDPQNGAATIKLLQGDPAVTVLSSDKGVGFTFVPNDDGEILTTFDNADCGPNATICIGIETEEENLFRSPPIDDAADESVCVTYNIGPPTSKTPTLAWAGQRVVLSHDWTDAVSDCDQIYVLYSVQAGPGSFTAALQGNVLDVSQTGQDVIVEVDPADCISHVIFENQDQAQNDIIAYVVDGIDLSTAKPVSQQVPFVIYYMKFEDATLTLVPGSRAGHNSGLFSPADPFDSTDDVTEMSDVNVSADVLARLRVRGWVTTTNCPVRDSGTGANGEFLPANRCIFPDDWRFKAGGGVGGSLNDPATVAGFAEDSRPNFDLDGDGVINAWDAPMPPALARFGLVGSGFLRPADKSDIYPSNSNPFYAINIPASPFIAPINADLSGYQWNTFGGPGAKSGPYDFWTDLADNGPEVLSCAGPNPCSDGVPTGGYLMTKVYTDNHGEAMTWVNGDAALTFDDCVSSASAAGHMIVLLSGYYCEEDDLVGSSTLSASVDYPDKRKHFAIQSDDVTIDWTWGGIKEVTIEPGESAQFNYVVFHVTDRDGFCGTSPSLHPVLGERVVFTIDSPSGIIFPDANGNAAALLGTWDAKSADVTTFDTALSGNSDLTQTVVVDDECQAWIHISESLLDPVNVIVTAYDPEGTVTFDKIINPAATPAPPTPSPTPFTLTLTWGDTDCSNGNDPVMARDSQAILRHVLDQPALSTTPPCLEIGEAITVVGKDGAQWADWDCDGNAAMTRDSQAVLRHVLDQTPLSATGDCPAIGDAVEVQPLVP